MPGKHLTRAYELEQELGKVITERGGRGEGVADIAAQLCREYNTAAMRAVDIKAFGEAQQMLEKAKVCVRLCVCVYSCTGGERMGAGRHSEGGN